VGLSSHNNLNNGDIRADDIKCCARDAQAVYVARRYTHIYALYFRFWQLQIRAMSAEQLFPIERELHYGEQWRVFRKKYI
jgi:hypothetical protein